VKRAAELYQSGQSLKTVAPEFDVNPTTVHRALRKVGFKLRPRNGWRYGESD
jgi:transposase-like protein